MGIDYVVDYACEPKKAIGLERIIDLLKDRSRAVAALQLLRGRGNDAPIESLEFDFVARTPDGDLAPRRVKVKEVLDRAVALDEFAPACEECPANNAGRPYGCIGAVSYPLSHASETWLLGRIRRGPGAEVLRSILVELGPKLGQDIAKMRTANGVFFEARVGPSREDLGFSLLADQLLDLIFCQGPLVPAHASIVLVALAAVRQESPVPETSTLPPGTAMLIGRDANGVESAQLYDIPAPRSDDDDSVKELKAFFRALFLARGFGVKLLVDF